MSGMSNHWSPGEAPYHETFHPLRILRPINHGGVLP